MKQPDDLYLDSTNEDAERESLAEVVCIEHARVIICGRCGLFLDEDV